MGDKTGGVKKTRKYKKTMLYMLIAAGVIVICIAVGLMMNHKGGAIEFTGVNAIVVEIDRENQTMIVEGVDENSVIGDRCELTWNGNPFTSEAPNGGTKTLSLEDFSVGDSVMLSIGAVQETYPTRANAIIIQLRSKDLKKVSE